MLIQDLPHALNHATMHTTGVLYPYTSMPPYRFFPKFGTQIDKSCQDIHHIHDTKHNKSDHTLYTKVYFEITKKSNNLKYITRDGVSRS